MTDSNYTTEDFTTIEDKYILISKRRQRYVRVSMIEAVESSPESNNSYKSVVHTVSGTIYHSDLDVSTLLKELTTP